MPTGTGVLLMANKNVHVFENTFDKNKTAHVHGGCLFRLRSPTMRLQPAAARLRDPRQHLRRRRKRSAGPAQGATRSGALGGSASVAIVWDGVTKYGDKTEDVRIVVREKPEVGFINLGLETRRRPI